MHILHLSSAKTWRGGEQQIAYLIEELREKEIPQCVFCVENAPFSNWCQKNNIPYFIYKKRSSIDPKIVQKLKQIVRSQKITHIHAHDSHAHTFAFLAALLFGLKQPIIVSRRVDFPIKDSFFSRWKYNHKSIRKIICISQHIERVMQPAIKETSKLTVVHSGIRLDKFKVENNNILRQEFKIPANKKIIANIAALADHKDYPSFVRTAEILLKKRNDLQFFIIGGNAGEEIAIRQLISAKGLEKDIILTGHRTDIAVIFPELDVLLFTSKEEGLGTTILDAFACKVPVVASSGGGIPEVVVHEKTGWLAPVGHTQKMAAGVEFLLENQPMRMVIIAHAYKHLQNFSAKKMAAAVLSVYHTVS